MCETKIPKIIHYCWFGENPMPERINECMKTWDILKKEGYKIVRWDETNCSFEENDYVRKAFLQKKWAFVSDYYRTKALYEWGGYTSILM